MKETLRTSSWSSSVDGQPVHEAEHGFPADANGANLAPDVQRLLDDETHAGGVVVAHVDADVDDAPVVAGGEERVRHRDRVAGRLDDAVGPTAVVEVADLARKVAGGRVDTVFGTQPRREFATSRVGLDDDHGAPGNEVLQGRMIVLSWVWPSDQKAERTVPPFTPSDDPVV